MEAITTLAECYNAYYSTHNGCATAARYLRRIERWCDPISILNVGGEQTTIRPFLPLFSVICDQRSQKCSRVRMIGGHDVLHIF